MSPAPKVASAPSVYGAGWGGLRAGVKLAFCPPPKPPGLIQTCLDRVLSPLAPRPGLVGGREDKPRLPWSRVGLGHCRAPDKHGSSPGTKSRQLGLSTPQFSHL